MRPPLLIALALLGAAPAFAAEEPSGCDKFKWNIDHERAALTSTDQRILASGTELTYRATCKGRDPGPGRAGRGEAAVAARTWPEGRHARRLRELQDGHFLKPRAFSGATDCEGIRKTMKYELAASPFVLQISGTPEQAISIAILPSD